MKYKVIRYGNQFVVYKTAEEGWEAESEKQIGVFNTDTKAFKHIEKCIKKDKLVNVTLVMISLMAIIGSVLVIASLN